MRQKFFQYIYIIIHRQTVSFCQNSSVWLDTQDARSRDRNPSNFRLDKVSDLSATKRTTLAKGIFKVFILATAAAAFVYILYTLSATRVLNSFEELRITLAAADNSCLVWFYGTSTIVGYLMPYPFLYIQTVLFQTIFKFIKDDGTLFINF